MKRGKNIRFGFSPCPNDTYIFCALANGLVRSKDLRFEFTIDDVETLNYLAIDKKLDVSKVSCHAYFYLKDKYRFLRYGAAFGRGCGPLVVSREALSPEDLSGLRIAVPGIYTTANLLLRLFAVKRGIKLGDVFITPFNYIMSAVRDGLIDVGLIIHEGRFTYGSYGLHQVVDLGRWWEEDTGLPIPLGGIVARRSLSEEKIITIEKLIRESILYADNNTSTVMPYIKEYAQELSEDVIGSHIGLYVNDYSREFSPEASRALEELIIRTEGVKEWIRP